MNNNNSSRIWQPSVDKVDRVASSGSSSQLYTKTSLARDKSESATRLQSLNREILRASQAYNSTPRPFTRPSNQTSASGNPSIHRDLFSSKRGFQEPRSEATNISSQVYHNQQENSQQPYKTLGQNMAPKLVHNQYNSPLDLYSMNNIRKSIEAHTEMLAPGLKGINFMRPDAQVNKQSEVYKLIMEEERGGRQTTSRLSPISGQPLNLPSGLSSQSELQAQEIQNLGKTEDLFRSPMKQAEQGRVNNGIACCECGRQIVGPFAKIQNRFVHPQCFNCTTCGTSLKNIGHFTINEKLYCELHAKQVADMMRIQYDFANTQKGQHVQESSNQPRLLEQQSHPAQAQYSLPSTVGECSINRGSHSSSPVSISTMFAGRPFKPEEKSWSWRPASDKDRTTGGYNSTVVDGANTHFKHQEVGSQMSSSKQQSSQISQHFTSSIDARQHEHTNSIGGNRVPVCVRCQVHIQGPYILAGRSTWCKLCSQTNFNCKSCQQSLLQTGFVQDSSNNFYCESCFEAYYAPICSKCNLRVKGDCLNALDKHWHPSCFVCGHCRRPFGNSSFYLEDNTPYCERDWKLLFTTKCFACSGAIEAGDKWIEALNRSYHSYCFGCSTCRVSLEGSSFYCKGGNPYCKMHAK